MSLTVVSLAEGADTKTPVTFFHTSSFDFNK